MGKFDKTEKPSVAFFDLYKYIFKLADFCFQLVVYLKKTFHFKKFILLMNLLLICLDK
jgi:hypothetical protein